MKSSKKIKNIFTIIAIIFSIMILFPVNAQAAGKIKLNMTKKTMNVGEKTTLKVKGTKKKVKWSSNNKKVATVTQKGKVTAKKSGNATITAKVSKNSLKCKITVDGLKLPIGKNIGNGEMYLLTAGGTSENGYTPKVLAKKDTIVLQIGLRAKDFDGSHISFVYIDKNFYGKEQLSDTQTALNLRGSFLKKGLHRVSVAQYKGDKEGGEIITYKEAKYKVVY